MSEYRATPETGVPEKPGQNTSYVAVGIPQGVVVDRASGEVAGAVRRGGELVSLEEVEYALWTSLLTPMTPADIRHNAASDAFAQAEQAIARLLEMNLLVRIEPGKPLDQATERLRPLPLGLGLGNSSGDPMTFEIQNATLSLPTPVSLNVVGAMFWWEFDGTRSLRAIARRVADQLPDLAAERADVIVVRLAHSLMAGRLIYLDRLAP